MDVKEVEHIAALSRINLTENEKEAMGLHLDRVLGYFKTLDSLDTSAVTPKAHILPAVNVLREDISRPAMDREELISNAPETFKGAYVVPRVLD